MAPEETGQLLAMCAAVDRRTTGDADVLAWHKVIGDLPYPDCEAAVAAHYRDSRDWIMPADVRTRVKAMRRDRLEHVTVPPPDPQLADQPGRYRAELQAGIAKLASARSPRLAIAAPVREDAPPGEFTAARAALGPALPARGTLASKRQIALRQAADSRATRGATDPGAGPQVAGQED